MVIKINPTVLFSLLIFFITTQLLYSEDKDFFEVEIMRAGVPYQGLEIRFSERNEEDLHNGQSITLKTDEKGRVRIYRFDASWEKVSMSFMVFQGNHYHGETRFIENHFGELYRYEIFDFIDPRTEQRTLEWNSVSNASYYIIDGFEYADENPETAFSWFIHQKTEREYSIKSQNSYIEQYVKTVEPLFQLKREYPETLIPQTGHDIDKLGIRISAFDNNNKLLGISNIHPIMEQSTINEDQISIQFTRRRRALNNKSFDIISKDSDGEDQILATFNTGRDNKFVLYRDHWPEDARVRFTVDAHDSNKNKLTRNLALKKYWGNFVRFDLQPFVHITYKDDVLTWRESYLASYYKVTIYHYLKAERQRRSPNFVVFDYVDELSAPFVPHNITDYDDYIDPDKPVFETIVNHPDDFIWPESLGEENMYGLVVRAFDEKDNEISVSRLTPLPAEAPLLTWDNSVYDRDAAAIALSAIMMRIHKTNYDSLPIFPVRQSKIESLKEETLGNEWGIWSGEDLRETLNRLENRGHSYNLRQVLNVAYNYEDMPVWEAAMREGLRFSQLKRVYTVKRLKEYFDDRLLHAWDWGRAIYLIRWSYTVDYIGTEEAWELIHHFQDLIQKEYVSWKDFGQSYALGRFYWSSGNGKERSKTNEVFTEIDSLMRESENPWNGYWSDSELYVPTDDLPLEVLLDLSDEEKLFNTALFVRDNLRNHPSLVEEEIDRLLAGWNKYPQIIEILLLALEKAEDPESIIPYVYEAINEYPQYYPFHQMLSRLLEAKEGREEALEALNEMDEWASNLAVNKYLKGRLYYLLKDNDQAIEILKEPLKQQYEGEWFYYNSHYIQGIILLNENKAEESLHHLTIVYNNNSQNPYNKYYFGLAQLLSHQGDPLQIENLLRTAEQDAGFTIADWVWQRLTEYKQKVLDMGNSYM